MPVLTNPVRSFSVGFGGLQYDTLTEMQEKYARGARGANFEGVRGRTHAGFPSLSPFALKTHMACFSPSAVGSFPVSDARIPPRACKRYGPKPFLGCRPPNGGPFEFITFSDFDEQVNRARVLLHGAGVVRGDKGGGREGGREGMWS